MSKPWAEGSYMPKVKIWIDDNVGGTFPIDATIRREGAYLIFENKEKKFRQKIEIEPVMAALGDEGHG